MPVVWGDEVRSPGATFVRVHFSEFDLAPGDRLVISNLTGSEQYEYTARGPKGRGEFWAHSIDGEVAVITLQAKGRGGNGYTIDEVGEGFAPEATPEVVCGTDGRQDVACFGAAVSTALLPVARLLFQDGAFLAYCTTWMVDGSNANTAITNNHCLQNQADVDTAELTFNYQRKSCGGTVNTTQYKFDGAQFLKTNAALDYTLFTVAGDPVGLGAGELIATSADAAPKQRIAVPQHGGGNVKKIGVFEDAAHTLPCDITSVHIDVSGYAPSSQFSYACDTEGGSSGSPVADVATRRVIGLHHLGNVTLSPCTNGATHMTPICQDAGALLSCVND
jgi:V8-like Glu-specific endopeptidase